MKKAIFARYRNGKGQVLKTVFLGNVIVYDEKKFSYRTYRHFVNQVLQLYKDKRRRGYRWSIETEDFFGIVEYPTCAIITERKLKQ